MNVLQIVYSWAFALGGVAGILWQRAYCHAQARKLDKTHPRADGARHAVGGLNRVWIGGAVAVASLGYVLLLAQTTHDETVAIAVRVGQCSTNFQQAQAARTKITNEDNALQGEQSDLRLQIDEARQVWLDRLINPPADLVNLSLADPRRSAWSVDVTRVYQETTAKIGVRLENIVDRRAELGEQRRASPLPTGAC